MLGLLLFLPLVSDFCEVRMPAASIARGVVQAGDDPDAVSSVRRSDVFSTHHERPSGVAECFQRRQHVVSSASAQGRDVLSQDPTGPELADDPVHLPPEAGPLALKLGTAPGATDVLAGEAAANKLN
jgi:hypothetical protein